LPHMDLYDKQRNSTMSGKKKSLPTPFACLRRPYRFS
jgi:hypothetical protein